jgi:hypothetical protein
MVRYDADGLLVPTELGQTHAVPWLKPVRTLAAIDPDYAIWKAQTQATRGVLALVATTDDAAHGLDQWMNVAMQRLGLEPARDVEADPH